MSLSPSVCGVCRGCVDIFSAISASLHTWLTVGFCQSGTVGSEFASDLGTPSGWGVCVFLKWVGVCSSSEWSLSMDCVCNEGNVVESRTRATC